MNRPLVATFAACLFATLASADTSQNGAILTIDEGVDFELGNIGAQSYTFNWSDPDNGPSFSNVVDPTLVLTAGETHTFVRVTGSHPFIIMDDSFTPFITGTDGTFSRTTTNRADLDAATLEPIADFTTDPAPSGDVITWTPEPGDYWYTCRVTGHRGMTGRIQVVAAPCPGDTDDNATIDLDDLLNVVINFGTDDPAGDTNADGTVDLDDLLDVVLNFGVTCG